MKKLNIILLLSIVILYIINTNNSLAQADFDGDLGLEAVANSTCTVTITIETSSIPFEGRANEYVAWNRVDTIMNGSVYKLFLEYNQDSIYPIYFHDTTRLGGGAIFDLGFSNELPHPGTQGAWGYARYKITFLIEPSIGPKEKYVLYFNSLDSKYSKKFFPDSSWTSYSVDWKITYFQYSQKVTVYGLRTLPSIDSTFGEVYTWDTLQGGEPSKEFKVWKMLHNRDMPWEKKFYARTTPFPIAPYVADHVLRDLTIGTKVIFDTVYNNLGDQDRYGYNTWIDSNAYHDYYLRPPIPPGENVLGNTFCTPAQLYQNHPVYTSGMKITAEQGDTLIMKRLKKLWISGHEEAGWGDTIHFEPNSTLILEPNAGIFPTFGGVLINEGANVVWNNTSCHRVFEKSELYYKGNNTVNNGGYIEIDGNAKLKLGDNTTLTFDGSNSYLKLNPNAQVKLGSNAKIEFKNGAYIDANNVTFSTNGSSPWEGLYFENAGSQTTITNCTLNTVKNPIKIVNTNTNYMNSSKIIKNNIFNLHQNGSHCVYAENVFDINIDGNTFNVPPYDGITRSGTYIRNHYNISSNGHIDIVNNTFSGGYISLILYCLASNLTPVFVNNNTFNSAGLADLIGMKISGDIKNNNFSASSLNRNLAFSMSNAYLYKNIMYAGNINMNLAGNSTVHLAPSTYNQDNLAWSAGQNKFTSQNYDNVHIGFGNIYPDYGNNHFTCATNNYHLFGHLNTSSTFLNARNNCWYTGNNSARGFLLNNSYQQITIDDYKTPGFQCPHSIPTQTEIIIVDKGYDIYDTIVVTEGYPESMIPEDERFYNLALQKMDAGLYLDAIAAYKYYIDSYTESQFLNTSLYEIYECHEMLDTSDNQEYRDVLYGELRNYLDAKILSELYDGEFVDIAYNLILMCEANMDNLDDALDGYEFLALFHPDPEARILASWDWDAVLDLLDSGTSGGITEKIIKMDKQRRLKKFEKLIDSDPLMKRLHDTYRVQENKIKQNTEKVIRSRTRDDRSANEKIIRAKDRDQKLKTRASTNLTILRHLSDEEKGKRLIEDITLLYGNKYGENDNSTTNKIIPDNYSLSQNYPNPFNPSTTINYELPKDGTVKLIIYDILGREVSRLVYNEFKAAGRYSVAFDGSNLSSGIYFYKIEVGSFTDIKRMVLIK
ncbi:MAG: T9SS type A sorting domain-containing protein [Ignavibacteria bacterium]|nr:T9SS type A sorting domain-containing protein [Ignavibacteria bacterium]